MVSKVRTRRIASRGRANAPSETLACIASMILWRKSYSICARRSWFSSFGSDQSFLVLNKTVFPRFGKELSMTSATDQIVCRWHSMRDKELDQESMASPEGELCLARLVMCQSCRSSLFVSCTVKTTVASELRSHASSECVFRISTCTVKEISAKASNFASFWSNEKGSMVSRSCIVGELCNLSLVTWLTDREYWNLFSTSFWVVICH